MKKPNARAFLRAADLIKSEYFACIALNRILAIKIFDDTRPEHTFFSDVFYPGESDGSSGGWFGCTLKPKNQLARELALNFCYEMLKHKKKGKRK